MVGTSSLDHRIGPSPVGTPAMTAYFLCAFVFQSTAFKIALDRVERDRRKPNCPFLPSDMERSFF